ncbi:MAG: ABC transporter substrate-binding protein [Bacteroidetes bacterium]|nr:ABC transporter substrate-binding protein [Bacteroidota bacterium]
MTKHAGLIRTIFIYCLALFMISCGNGDSTVKKKETGNVFRYNQHTGISSLDPAFSRDQATMWATHQLFDGLVEVNEKLEVVPAMARSWKLSNDGMMYEFVLRDDVFFHDDPLFENGNGRKAVASDFVYSFERLLDESVASTGAWLLRGKVKDTEPFEAINDTTLRIHLKVPFRPFLGILTLPYFSVVPNEVVEHYGKDFRVHPIGTGPFVLKVWDENTVLSMLRNPNYYMKDESGTPLPYLDAVKVSFIGDRQAEFEEFKQGNLDFVSGIDPTYKDMALTESGELREEHRSFSEMLKFPYLNTEYLGFSLGNQEVEALKDRRVRQAINYGFDREKMIRFLRNGIGMAAHSGMIPAGLPAHDKEKVPGYHYDLKKARQLLADAGYPNGEGIGEITLNTSSGYVDMVTFIAKSLEDIGLQVIMEMTDPSLQRELMRKNGLDFFRASWIGDFPDGENYLALFYGGYDAPPNYTRFENERFDELYERSTQESDPATYIPMYQEMERIVLEEAPVVPLYYDEVVRFVNKRVQGLPHNAMNLLDLKSVSVN